MYSAFTDLGIEFIVEQYAALNVGIERRIVFYNGYMLVVEGRCSLGNNDSPRQRTVTCKTGPKSYKRHFLGLTDNVTYFAEQLESANVSGYHYRVIFKTQSIAPNIDLETSIAN